MKLKKGVDPKGTEHYKTMMSGPGGLTAHYHVIAVTGMTNHAPSTDEPIVWLRLSRKTPRPVDNFINLPLSVFVSLFEQASEDDVFWENEKQDAND